MDISVVIAAYNEEDNILELYSRLSPVLKRMKSTYEIIFIDDGSKDSTFYEMEKITKKDKAVKVIKFRRNFGQTASWKAGFDNSSGDIIVTMDADLQNDPNDIPKLVQKIDEGYDFVSGWRNKRKDDLSKKMFSTLSRALRNRIISDPIHDSGCSLKAYKKECVKNIELYGEMHRYIAELLILQGYKAGEVKVNHLPRKNGRTKYNLLRLPKGFLDLLVVLFWQKYSARPVHLFGGIGILMAFAGMMGGAYLTYIKFAFHASIASRPLLMLSVLLIVLGLQFFIFGLIADVLIRLYYSGERKNYSIEKIINK